MIWAILCTGLFTVGSVALLAWSSGSNAQRAIHESTIAAQHAEGARQYYLRLQNEISELIALSGRVDAVSAQVRKLSGQVHAARRWSEEPREVPPLERQQPACECGWCEACTQRKLAAGQPS